MFFKKMDCAFCMVELVFQTANSSTCMLEFMDHMNMGEIIDFPLLIDSIAQVHIFKIQEIIFVHQPNLLDCFLPDHQTTTC